MILPQFSIRLLILITAIVAVFAMVASWGGNGVAWAAAATMALGMFVLSTLVLAATFGLVALIAPAVRTDERGNFQPVENVKSSEAINSATEIPPPIQSPGPQA